MTQLLQHVFKIVELYPEQMNIYGDTGNALVLAKRLQLYGLRAEVTQLRIGDELISDPDIIIGGGGQDSSQVQVAKDLLSHKSQLQHLADAGVPMLVICGMYQLFGSYFITADSEEIAGIEIFNAITVAPPATTITNSTRLVGNIIANSGRFGQLVGYENHSGRTTILPSASSLTSVLCEQVELGVGNGAELNGSQANLLKSEGCITRNVIGTYLHGPVLPKNPVLADFLIETAVKNVVGQSVTLRSHAVTRLDEIANRARQAVVSR